MNSLRIGTRVPHDTALKAAILALAVVLFGVLGYRQLVRLTATPVWTAGRSLSAPNRIEPGDLKLVYRSKKSLPAGHLLDKGAIEGRLLRQPKAKGEPFSSADFAVPPAPNPASLAELVPEGRVLITLKLGQVRLPYTRLRLGDRLELVAVGGSGQASSAEPRVIATDAFLIGTMAPASAAPAAKKTPLGVDLSPPQRKPKGAGGLSLILALHPQDVLPVAESTATDASISFVLHGQREVQRGELLPIGSPGAHQVELISGAQRKRIEGTPPRLGWRPTIHRRPTTS